MSDIYELITNDLVKSIIFNYVTNSFEYKFHLYCKYHWEFFRIKLPKYRKDNLTITDNLVLYKKILSNFRWYISESYLKDIKTLKGKTDLNIFWSRLQKYWSLSIFSKKNYLPNYKKNFNIRFVLDNLGSLEEPSKEIKCCLIYGEDKDVYRLAISHEYIESNFFDSIVDYLFYVQYISALFYLEPYSPCLKLGKIYNTIVTLYKDSPDYKIKGGFLVI